MELIPTTARDILVNQILDLNATEAETPEERAGVIVARELAKINLTLYDELEKMYNRLDAIRNEIELANL